MDSLCGSLIALLMIFQNILKKITPETVGQTKQLLVYAGLL